MRFAKSTLAVPAAAFMRESATFGMLCSAFLFCYASGTDAIGYDYLVASFVTSDGLRCPPTSRPLLYTQLSFLIFRSHQTGFVQIIDFSAVEMHDRELLL